MNRQLLEQPFSPEEIKQRDGSFGQTLAYVSGHTVIQRLNDAFESAWSFEIVSHEIQQDEVIVLGKLTAESTVKTQFGSSRITRARETGEMISLADDLKSAATDALKKCATLFGVGLHLYADKPSPDTGTSKKGNGDDNSQSGNNGNGNGRLTSKQHSFLLKLANEKGMTRKELNDQCVATYGAVIDFLTRQHASSLIENMLAQ
ncbi:Rad52/Rad22 family DNA repair protein [Thermodesulfobacteriota bacterium]